MIEDKLEIMIPTYNRAKYLDYTLNALLHSPFKDCRIIVRDNASPDNTPEICEKYSKLFKNFVIIRNKFNIGGNANILRCYEDASLDYVWVLADNDLLNFDDCEDFVEAIDSEKYGLIICCSASFAYSTTDEPSFDYGFANLLEKESDKKNYLENTAEELVSIIKNYYFSANSFISSGIYKTSLIDSDYLIQGYDYIHYYFPHFPLFVKALNENVLTYKTKKDVVLLQENPKGSFIFGVDIHARSLNCALLLKDKKYRKYASQLHAHGLLYISLGMIITGKYLNEKNMRSHIIDLIIVIYKLKGLIFGTFYAIPILLGYLIPKKLCVWIFNNKNKIVKKIMMINKGV